MITVKKDALKYKGSDGQMQSAGVLCQVGTLGVNWLDYATTFSNVFVNVSFPSGSILDMYIPNVTSLDSAFRNASGLDKIKLKRDSDISTNFSLCFQGCDAKVIDLSEFNCTISNANGMFRICRELKEIVGELDISKASSVANLFANADSLEKVSFKKGSIYENLIFNHSAFLSGTSIQSIIDGLADLTGQTAQTLTFHADVKAKLTEEQIATITSKNWTLA